MKTFKIFIIFLLLLTTFFNKVYADDEDFEIMEDISPFIETSTPINVEAPSINSRAAIVFDRSSGLVLYGKNENEKRKMASTTNVMVTQTTLFKCRFFFTNFICNTLFFS